MEFVATALPEVVLIKPRRFGDDRGYFMETWQQEKFAAAGIQPRFVQDNHSHSVRHTLRGLHYQIQQPQGKLVRVTSGAAFDVAVDIRRSSPNFGRWVGVELTSDNHHMLWVPPGFAHGFLVLSDSAHFLYKCTAFYAPEDEQAIRWDDADLAVRWPLPAGQSPVISGRDAAARAFREAPVYP